MKTLRHKWGERPPEGNCRRAQSHRRAVSEMTSGRKQLMNRLFAFILSAAAVLLLALAATAQNPRPQNPPVPAPTPDPNQAEVVNIRRVRLPITVTDKKGAFVSGLTQNDFVVLEDKVPQKIDSFTNDENNNLPLYVAVLMDTSPSTAAKLKFEQ